jgi:DNA polymerase III beta subunit, C-terminal domain.
MIEYALKHKNDITVFMHEDKEKSKYYYSYVLGSNAIGSFETVQFPNYRRILNYEETLSIRFNRKAFIDSLKNVVVGEKNMVRFSINGNKFVLQGEDYANTVEVTEWSCIISKFSGAVNKIYLLEALNAFDTQHVEWKWQKVNNLSCTELVDEKSELRHVLMPMNPEYV